MTDSDNIHVINGPTKLDIPAERVLLGALKADLDRVVIAGYDKHGNEYLASSMGDGAAVLWLVERLKMRVLQAPADEAGD